MRREENFSGGQVNNIREMSASFAEKTRLVHHVAYAPHKDVLSLWKKALIS